MEQGSQPPAFLWCSAEGLVWLLVMRGAGGCLAGQALQQGCGCLVFQ